MRVREIAGVYGAECTGCADTAITTAAPLAAVAPGAITIVRDRHELEAALAAGAGAAFVPPGLAAAGRLPSAVICPDPLHRFLAFARLAAARAELDDGIHPSAVVHPSAQLGTGVRIGPHCSVAREARIGSFTTLLEGARVRRGAAVGAATVLRTGAVIGPRVTIGSSCDIGENAVVGSDHARYEMGEQHWERRAGDSSLAVADDVVIGPGTVVERGNAGGTAIAAGATIGGQVYVAHDVTVEPQTLIVAQSGIASFSTIGRGAMILGRVGIVGSVRVGERATICAGSTAWKDVPPASRVLGYPARPYFQALRQLAAAK